MSARNEAVRDDDARDAGGRRASRRAAPSHAPGHHEGALADDVMYHLVAAEWFRDGDRAQPYVPEAYAADGFIHCTDGMANVVDVGNRYYRDDRRMYVALVIARTRVLAEVRYEDAARIYPHIYGALNRDAIVDILPMLRGPDGAFLPAERQRTSS